jgi:galactokinase
MTLDTILDRLRDAGLPATELESKAALYGLVLRTFARRAGGDPACAWWSPGRIEVFGTHTDYGGGRTLVAAVPRGLAFVARARPDGLVRIIDAAAGEDATIDPRLPASRRRGWRRYAAVVASRLARNFPGAEVGADVVFASDLPRAAGVSSSSALVVGLATVLVHLAGLRRRADWQDALGGPYDEAGYYACLENGLSFGPLGGDGGVGVHGGSEDHAAIVHGVAGHVSMWSFVPVRHLGDAPVPEDWTFCVAASGVTAAKAGGARERYNRLSTSTRDMLRLVNERDGSTWPSLAAALAGDDRNLPWLREVISRVPVAGWTPADLADRLAHFVNEDARVADAFDAFAAADAAAIGRLARESQEEAETLLHNQTVETNTLARLALEAGALGSRSFGAGFGGSVWALVRRADAAGFLDRWLQAYRATGLAGASANGFEARPAPPLTQVLG